MESTGFMTLISIMIAVYSNTPKWRRIILRNCLGFWHITAILLILLSAFSSLYYDFLAKNELLLPFSYIDGFDEKSVLLTAAIGIISITSWLLIFGEVRQSKYTSLHRDISLLIKKSEYDTVSSILINIQDFFLSERSSMIIYDLAESRGFMNHLYKNHEQLYINFITSNTKDGVAKAIKKDGVTTLLSDTSIVSLECKTVTEGDNDISQSTTPVLSEMLRSPTVRGMMFDIISGILNKSTSEFHDARKRNEKEHHLWSRTNFIIEKNTLLFRMIKFCIQNELGFEYQHWQIVVDSGIMKMLPGDGYSYRTEKDVLLHPTGFTSHEMLKEYIDTVDEYIKDNEISDGFAGIFASIFNTGIRGHAHYMVEENLISTCLEIYKKLHQSGTGYSRLFAVNCAKTENTLKPIDIERYINRDMEPICEQFIRDSKNANYA